MKNEENFDLKQEGEPKTNIADHLGAIIAQKKNVRAEGSSWQRNKTEEEWKFALMT